MDYPDLGGGLGIARMLILQGRFEEAEQACGAAEQLLREHGDRFLMAEAEAVLGDICRLSDRTEEAVVHHRAGYDGKIGIGDVAFASTSAAELSRALADAGRADEALRYANIAIDTSASDDIASQGGGHAAKGRALSLLGSHAEAQAASRAGVAIMAATDYLAYHADALVGLAEVLHAAGKRDEAISAMSEAAELYRRKGATFLVDQSEHQIAEWEA